MKEIKKVELRHLKMSDYTQLRESMIKSYHDMQESIWSKQHIGKLLEIFPEGQIVILADDHIVGCALSIMIDWDSIDDEHTYAEVTGNYTFSTYDPEGDFLYGIDIFISPEYRGLRLGRRLYDARKELCEKMNLKGILFGGRIPLYSEYADELTPKEYIAKVARKEIYDPVLSFQLSNDFHVKRILKDYLEGDTSSREFATLMEWNNIYYVKSPKMINARKSVVRLGLVQWQMRDMSTIEELFSRHVISHSRQTGSKRRRHPIRKWYLSAMLTLTCCENCIIMAA